MKRAQLEAIVFATAKPLNRKQLAAALEISVEDVEVLVNELKEMRNVSDSGVHVLDHNGSVQLVSNPEHEEVLRQFVKDEDARELTRPSLETLTIIAYRGPITKPEIEHIRGVNCTLILRNLLMRGMIVETQDKEKLQPSYTVSETFLRHLGLQSVEELPSYESFAENEDITRLLEDIGEDT